MKLQEREKYYEEKCIQEIAQPAARIACSAGYDNNGICR